MRPVTKPGRVRLEEDVFSFSYGLGLEPDFLENAKECREFSGLRDGGLHVDILSGSASLKAVTKNNRRRRRYQAAKPQLQRARRSAFHLVYLAPYASLLPFAPCGE